MEDLKQIVADNIADLRKKHSITQAELAEKLNYSDKAVSKWERGESIPDVGVLKEIADIFSVKIDYLVTADHTDAELVTPRMSKRRARNHRLILAISIMLVWLIATFIFVNIQLIVPTITHHWMAFIYALPVTCIVWLVFNSVWFIPKLNFVIISLLLWLGLVAIYLSLFCFAHVNAWLLFVLGIPGQVIIILWSGIYVPRRKSQ